MFRRLLLVAALACGIFALMANVITASKVNHPVTASELSPSDLVVWAEQAALAMYTYDYNNYAQRLAETEQYFSSQGWQDYLATTARYQNPVGLKRQQLRVAAVMNGKTQFNSQPTSKQNIFKANCPITVKVPLLVSYRNGNEVKQQSVLVVMKVVANGNNAQETHFAITQIVAKKGVNLVA